MKLDQFETKLERFVINHYLGISNVLAVVFLVGEVLCLVFGNPMILGAFATVMIGLAIIQMVLVGAPDRRRIKSWRDNENKRKKNEQSNQAFVLTGK